MRELSHYAQRAALGLGNGRRRDAGSDAALPERIAAYEAHLIEETLAGCGGDVRSALEIRKSRARPLHDKVERHGLNLARHREKSGSR